MKISVALCTYNGSRFVREQLDSIAAQTTLPGELVICDDGSTDTTADIVREFARVAPFEVRFIQNSERLGATKNFEKAITLCQGRIVALADQDDVWNRDKLSRMIDTMERDLNRGGAFSDADLIDEHSEPLGRRLWASIPFCPRTDRLGSDEFAGVLLKQHAVTGATLVFRAEFREQILPIPTCWVHDAWIAWMLVLYSSLALIRDPLMRYRIHGAQQFGVESLQRRVRRARRDGNVQYVDVARRFEQLRARWLERPGPEFDMRLRSLDRKIEHLHFQAALHANRFIRACQIVSALPSYYRYTRGLATVCRDLLV